MVCLGGLQLITMKWPQTLTLIRHDTSAYNILRDQKLKDPLYQQFLRSYNTRPWTEETKRLAFEISAKHSLKEGDHDTPLAKGEGWKAHQAGTNLQKLIQIPDIIYISPYLRTRQTLDNLCKGWQQLAQVPVVEDERLIEQDHGLMLAYNDWRVFNVMHPEQEALRKAQTRYWYRFPQGENIPDLRERIRSWFSTLIREHSGMHLLVVTHHLTILALRANLERLNAKEFESLDHQEPLINAGVTIYRGDAEAGKNGKLILDTYNKKLYGDGPSKLA